MQSTTKPSVFRHFISKNRNQPTNPDRYLLPVRHEAANRHPTIHEIHHVFPNDSYVSCNLDVTVTIFYFILSSKQPSPPSQIHISSKPLQGAPFFMIKTVTTNDSPVHRSTPNLRSWPRNRNSCPGTKCLPQRNKSSNGR